MRMRACIRGISRVRPDVDAKYGHRHRANSSEPLLPLSQSPSSPWSVGPQWPRRRRQLTDRLPSRTVSCVRRNETTSQPVSWFGEVSSGTSDEGLAGGPRAAHPVEADAALRIRPFPWRQPRLQLLCMQLLRVLVRRSARLATVQRALAEVG